MSHLEEMFALHLRCEFISFQREVALIPGRRFKFDYVLPQHKIAIEIQGGTWSKRPMGHNTGSGIKRDCEKSNLVQKYGYRLLKFTSDMVTSGEAIRFLIEFLKD